MAITAGNAMLGGGWKTSTERGKAETTDNWELACRRDLGMCKQLSVCCALLPGQEPGDLALANLASEHKLYRRSQQGRQGRSDSLQHSTRLVSPGHAV